MVCPLLKIKPRHHLRIGSPRPPSVTRETMPQGFRPIFHSSWLLVRYLILWSHLCTIILFWFKFIKQINTFLVELIRMLIIKCLLRMTPLNLIHTPMPQGQKLEFWTFEFLHSILSPHCFQQFPRALHLPFLRSLHFASRITIQANYFIYQ